MRLNRTIISTQLFLAVSMISVFCQAQEKNKSRIRPVIPYNHATLNAPPNMAYVRGGSTTIRYNQSVSDTTSIKKVSLTSFFMDKTEITNQQYRAFTEWVIDSIAIFKYLHDESYFIGYKGDTTVTVTSEETSSSMTDSTSTTTIAAPPTPQAPQVADSEITYDSVIYENVPPPAINEEVKDLFNRALKGITFETSKDLIRKTSYPILDQVADALKKNPTYSIQINGHTDNQGRAAANQVLSEKRAISVKNYLVGKGIDPSRMKTAGYGGDRPIDDNSTPEGREKNRRVEFIADIPAQGSGATTGDAGGATKRSRTIKVTRMVMRQGPATATSTEVDVDTAKGYDPSKKRINWARVDHNKIFDKKNRDLQKKLAPLLDENGDIKKEKYMFSYTYLKTMNTTSNSKSNQKYVTEPINIYPNETVWAEDLTNSQTDLLVENYFKIPPYDDYPVVGVTWRQARAFCYWRSITFSHYSNMPEFMKYYHLTFSLPSEAQWTYAASGYYDMIRSNPDTASESETTDTSVMAAIPADTTGLHPVDTSLPASLAPVAATAPASKNEPVNPRMIEGAIIDSTPIHHDEKGLLSNFKQGEGDYWEDGAALTLPVMSYAPNEFGIYNMEGNVSEWVLDAYSPSTFSFVSDLNPALIYDADPTDVDAMRRKVVRGGSFISAGSSLGTNFRDLELDNVSHCYLGFRCVLSAPEVLYRPVQTRKKKMVGPNANKVAARRTRN